MWCSSQVVYRYILRLYVLDRHGLRVTLPLCSALIMQDGNVCNVHL